MFIVGATGGSLTMQSYDKILNCFIENCDLDQHSKFIDLGSGVGKALLHTATAVGCVMVKLLSLLFHYNKHYTTLPLLALGCWF
jgi:hypothetical protein